MRITIPALAAAISLAVFACTDDTSSPQVQAACKYIGDDFNLGNNEIFVCGEVPSDSPNLKKQKQDCEDDGGEWIDACPGGEKTTCKSDEEGDEDVVIKIYRDDVACGDLGWKNADGSESVVQMGGGCGPFMSEEGILECVELPETPTFSVKQGLCPQIGTSFTSECESNANLVCSKTEDGIKMIWYYYHPQLSGYSCSEIDMEEL